MAPALKRCGHERTHDGPRLVITHILTAQHQHVGVIMSPRFFRRLCVVTERGSNPLKRLAVMAMPGPIRKSRRQAFLDVPERRSR